MKCPTCLKRFTDHFNTHAIRHLGECLKCDHVRGDSIDVGDEEHMAHVGITQETTEHRGEALL